LLFSLVLLGGCAVEPKRVVVPRNVLYVCPPEILHVRCPDWPEGDPKTVRDLMRGHLEGGVAHAECRAAVRAWEAAWKACHGEAM